MWGVLLVADVALAAHLAPEEYDALFGWGGPRLDPARTLAHHSRLKKARNEGAMWVVGFEDRAAFACGARRLEMVDRGVVKRKKILYARLFATAAMVAEAETECEVTTATPLTPELKVGPPSVTSDEYYLELGVTYAPECSISEIVAREMGNKSYTCEFGATSGFVRSWESLDDLEAALAKEPMVATVDVCQGPHSLNDDAAWTVQSNDAATKATPLWDDYGLSGEGVVVGMLDSGIHYDSCYFADGSSNFVTQQWSGIGSYPIWEDPNHRKIRRYIAYRDATDDTSGHGTHVAGSCCGENLADPAFQGLAPKSKIVFIDANDAATDASDSLYVPTYTVTFSEGLDVGASLTTHSWGNGYSNTPYYHSIAKAVDDVSFDNPSLLILMAAGNSGSAGAGTISLSASFKNGLAVGATTNPLTGLAYFSSQGPAFDNRIKPDIVAPGFPVESASTGQACDVTSKSGTSMATPIVAGLAALVVEFFEEGYYPTGVRGASPGFTPTGMLVKAMLVAMAEPLPGYDYTPNNLQGWGAVRADAVIDPTADLYVDGDLAVNPQIIDDDTAINYFFTIESTVTRDARFVLCWYDYPATIEATSSILINDLDLVAVRESDGATFYPNGGAGKDSLNTIERIIIPSAELSPGDVFTITISGTDLSSDQSYAFVGVGDFENVNQGPTTMPTTSHPSNQLHSCGFVGPYDISNWVVDDSRGAVDTSQLPAVLVTVSPNDGGGSGAVTVETATKGPGVFGFDWIYETSDGAYWDWFEVIVGSDTIPVSDRSGANLQTGHFEQEVTEGTTIGIHVHTFDGTFGAATITISNFFAPSFDSCYEAPTATPSPAPTPKPSPAPTPTPISAPTATPSPEPTPKPISAPTATPISAPTATPSPEPTPKPISATTLEPVSAPTLKPSPVPTVKPSRAPTVTPSRAPSLEPISAPTFEPSSAPISIPAPSLGTTCAEWAAYLPLDNGVAVDSTGKNSCVVQGATATTDRFNNPGGALLFDGYSNIECPDLAMGGADPRTYCAWARADDSSRSWYALFQSGEAGGTEACSRFELRFNDGNGRLFWVGGGPTSCNNIFTGSAAKVPNPTDWHFICTGYDGAEVVIHVDGAFLGAHTPPVPVETGPHQDLLIGHRSDGVPTNNAFGWVGVIDDVMVFTKALSTAEIDELYELTVVGSPAYSGSGCSETPAPSMDPTPVPTTYQACEDIMQWRAYYTFDDGLGVDSTTQGLDCVVQGATATTDRFNNPSGALLFDGFSNVECPDVAIGGADPRTYCAWARADDSSRSWYALFQSGEAGGTEACSRFELRFNDGNGRLFWVGGGPTSCNNIFTGSAAKVPNPRDWHFICTGYDGAEVVIHVDGAFLGTHAPPVPVATGPHQDLLIGHRRDGVPTNNAFGWVGVIDDVMVFTKVLSTSEISDLYDATVAGNSPLSIACA